MASDRSFLIIVIGAIALISSSIKNYYVFAIGFLFIFMMAMRENKVSHAERAIVALVVLFMLFAVVLAITSKPSLLVELNLYVAVRALAIWIFPIYVILILRRYEVSDYRPIVDLFFSIVVVYTLVEFFLSNYLPDLAQYIFNLERHKTLGLLRPEGPSHNSSMSSSLLVVLWLSSGLRERLRIMGYLILIPLTIIYASGVGFFALMTALFIDSINFYSSKIIKYRYLLLVFSVLSLFFVYKNYYGAGGLHPKLSSEYILYIAYNKIYQIADYLNGANYDSIFGSALVANKVVTSGDFGLLDIIRSLGIYGFFIIYIYLNLLFKNIDDRAFNASFVFAISSLHYPLFVDPFSVAIISIILSRQGCNPRDKEVIFRA